MKQILTDINSKRKAKRDATSAWLERSNPLKGLTISAANNIFDAARTGDTQRLHWLFNEIEMTNPLLLTCVERRAAALAMKPWQVTVRASADSTLGDEQKNAVEELIAGIDNFSEAVEHLSSAFFRGFSYAQPIWENGWVKEISLLPSWQFLRKDGELYFNSACDGFTSNAVSCADAWLVSIIRNRAIDYPALSIHIRSAVGERDWGRFLERYALPKPAVFMAENATNDNKADYLAGARAVENGEVSVWPNGTNMIDFAGGSRGTDPFSSFIEHQEKLVVLLSTGGTLTSLAQADTGSLAGGAQMDVWREIVARDAIIIAQAFERDLIKRFLEFHFPGQKRVVDFSFDLTTKPTPKEMAEVAAVLKNAGYLVKQEELEEATGFTLEKAPEIPSQGGDFSLNKEDGEKTALQTHEKPLQNDSKALDEQGEGSSENTLVEALEGLFEKTLAETMAEELEKEGKGEGEGEEIKNTECRAQDPSKCHTHGTPIAKNDGKIDFKGNHRAKVKADDQATKLGYKDVDDMMSRSTSVPQEKIESILNGGDFSCEPHEAIATIRTLGEIKSNIAGEVPVKLSEHALRHYICGERRHRKGEPEVSRLCELPRAIATIRNAESRHWLLDDKPTIVFPGDTPVKGTQTVYTKRFGKNHARAFAYTNSGVLNGWQVNEK